MNDRPKALVMLAPAFPANESETNWVPSQQVFVAAMKERYPEVHLIVLTFYYPDDQTPYQWNGVEVIPFNGSRYRKGRRFIFWNRIWKELNRIRREFELMGLFSFWCGECAAVGHYFGRRHGIPHYCWICGQDAKAGNKWVRWIRPGAGELIAMSDFLVEEFERNHGIRPARMIPNAIDPGLFPAMAGGQRDIDLLAAGSLSRLKRYPLFVEAVGALRQSLPDIRAVLCGEGEERELLMQLVRKYELSEQLTMTGELPHQEVLGLMQRARVFLHTSEYEGFGVVCLEALYAGAHVVSFCRPLKEDISHWHVVSGMEEMISITRELLLDAGPDNGPVLRHTMKESAEAVMGLFYTGRI
jgi:glycosyltransferase involved in cell wall biosynthesis